MYWVCWFLNRWIALDKCATQQEPLLLKYETGIPDSVFDPLILPRKEHMERILRIESHISGRKKAASPENPTLFEKANAPTSFGIQYYEQSTKHQKLKADIEQLAHSHRSEKTAELLAKKERYLQLKRESASRSCEFHTVSRDSNQKFTEVQVHAPNCKRCSLNKQAEKMSIDIHEWWVINLQVKRPNSCNQRQNGKKDKKKYLDISHLRLSSDSNSFPADEESNYWQKTI